MAKTIWKKSRGKLGIFAPLFGEWVAEADSPMGKLKCVRSFETVLNGNYVSLNAKWMFKGSTYEEQAMIGMKDGKICFWSFTNDGKNSFGELADGTDVHPEAIAFEAQMPAGLARMIYWPDPDGGFHWAVEARNKKGWKRFTEHHYQKAK